MYLHLIFFCYEIVLCLCLVGLKIFLHIQFYTVSQKTSPTFLAMTRESIDGFFIIFGRNVTEKASNYMLLHFPTLPN